MPKKKGGERGKTIFSPILPQLTYNQTQPSTNSEHPPCPQILFTPKPNPGSYKQKVNRISDTAAVFISCSAKSTQSGCPMSPVSPVLFAQIETLDSQTPVFY